jgi:hypothetical protein
VPANAGAGSRDSNYNVCVPVSACTGGGSYTGPGDVVSGATAWYGLRAYTAAIAAAHTQKLINIRNTSTSETCDVIVATNGGFGNVANCSGSSSGDTVAVFCAESGGSCTVTEAYDQTGGGFNVVQATAGNQPALLLSGCGFTFGGGGPCLSFTGAASFCLIAASAPTLTQPFSFSGVVNYTTIASNSVLIAVTSGASTPLMGARATNTILVSTSGTNLTEAASTATWYAEQGVVNNTSSVIAANGTSTSGTTGTGVASTAMTWGCVSNGNQALPGFSTEAGIWGNNVGFSGTQITNMTSNQRTYWGF